MPFSPAAESPTFEDVLDARNRLKGLAVRTPLLESPALNAQIGGRLLIKAEMLQRTGSFKFRGAYNRISRLSEHEQRAGVLAWSSGNHAQGVAAAAALMQTSAVIVMPKDAPALKIANTRALGAKVVFYDRYAESREEIGQRIAKDRGLVIVPPFDDPFIIAGQGTLGLELAEQAKKLGAKLDAVLVPCSGGGLSAGIALALAHAAPEAKTCLVEPQGFDDALRSLAAGLRLENAPGPASFCDALMAPSPGILPFALHQKYVASGFAVSDEETAEAMRQAFLHLKLVAEPGGAVALAAALSGKIDLKGKIAAVVCSGGNVDAKLFSRILAD